MRIAVFGAGAVGCWLGGRLAAGGASVTLIGRPRVLDELAGGLRVTELGGGSWTVSPVLATDAGAACDAELVLVTVKSGATVEAARVLAPVVARGAVVVSMQNGVRNPDVLRDELRVPVLAGVVPFNVIRRAPGEYFRASSGMLMVEDAPAAAPLVEACRTASLPLERRGDVRAVQWAKLLLNLNNALNALSGQPIATELADRDFRRCLAAAQREALAVLRAARQPLARLTPIPPSWMARLLVVPEPLFRRIAPRVITFDPAARGSMAHDLDAGRPTEVDYINGEVVSLAERLGRDAPVNRAITALVHAAEADGRRRFTGAEVWRELSAVR